MSQRAPGWGSVHSSPPASDSGGMLRKSRVGKGEPSLICQECQDTGAKQIACHCVLCDECAGGHTHA